MIEPKPENYTQFEKLLVALARRRVDFPVIGDPLLGRDNFKRTGTSRKVCQGTIERYQFQRMPLGEADKVSICDLVVTADEAEHFSFDREVSRDEDVASRTP